MNFWVTPDKLHMRVGRGIAWSIIGTVSAQGLALLASFPVARILGVEGYGALGALQSTVATVAILGTPAFGLAATRYVARYCKSDPSFAGRVLGTLTTLAGVTGALAAVLVGVFAHQLAEGALANAQLTGPLRLACVAVFFNLVNATQIGALSGFEAFQAIAGVNIFRGLVTIPALVVGARTAGLSGAMIGTIAIAAGSCVISQWCLRNEASQHGISLGFGSLFEWWTVVWQFVMPAVVGGVAATGSTWIGNVVLAHAADGYHELGIFNAANQWRVAVSLLPGLFSQTAVPILSTLNAAGDQRERRQLIRLNLLAVLCCTGIPALVIGLGAPLILAGYGPLFQNGRMTLSLLVASTIPASGAGVVFSFLAATGRMWVGVGLNVLWALVFVASVTFAPGVTSSTLGVAYLASHTVHLGASMALLGLYQRCRQDAGDAPAL
jgi:O-antigen/teichoic acid export membrane protein